MRIYDVKNEDNSIVVALYHYRVYHKPNVPYPSLSPPESTTGRLSFLSFYLLCLIVPNKQGPENNF